MRVFQTLEREYEETRVPLNGDAAERAAFARALAAARRELCEEIGVDASAHALTLIACLKRSNSFCSVYTLPLNGNAEDFVLQKEEVSEVRWCDPAGLMRMVSEGQLYNYGDAYFRMLFTYFKQRHQQPAAQEIKKL